MIRWPTLFFPTNPFKRCILCQQPASRSQAICEFCAQQLPWLTHGCARCGISMLNDTSLCGQCLQQPPLRTRTVSAFHYRFPVQQMITGFKFQAQFFYLPPLLQALHVAILKHYINDTLPDALLAVPLHRKRQQQRGFNQAQLIARYLQKKLAIPLIAYAVIRQLNTPAQAQLSAHERHQNLQAAFRIRKPEQIQNKHIAIIDDVITTGSTVEKLADLLLKQGAKRVDALSLARA